MCLKIKLMLFGTITRVSVSKISNYKCWGAESCCVLASRRKRRLTAGLGIGAWPDRGRDPEHCISHITLRKTFSFRPMSSPVAILLNPQSWSLTTTLHSPGEIWVPVGLFWRCANEARSVSRLKFIFWAPILIFNKWFGHSPLQKMEMKPENLKLAILTGTPKTSIFLYHQFVRADSKSGFYSIHLKISNVANTAPLRVVPSISNKSRKTASVVLNVCIVLGGLKNNEKL